MVGPRLVGTPKVKSAFACPPLTKIATIPRNILQILELANLLMIGYPFLFFGG
jgi:hypothetical protein